VKTGRQSVFHLHCRYPVDRVSPCISQDKEWGVYPRVAMCLAALDPASPPSWTPGLPHVQWHRISPPSEGGLWYCHVSSGSGPRLTVREGSDTATCPVAPDPASQPGRASVQPQRSQLYTPVSFCRGLRRCHVAYGPLRAAGHKHKEIVSWPVCAARPMSYQGERVGSQDACR
jgi:hypothetical protein